MKTSKHLKIPLLLLGLMIFISFGLGAASAATPGDNSTMYVSTVGNDTWDGQSTAYNSTTGSGPKATIANATGTVTADGNVYIADGTYKEANITIDKNMSIIGESQSGTIINGGNFGTVFYVGNNQGDVLNVTISNLTITNGTAIYGWYPDLGGYLCEFGGAINNGNCNLTVNNITFTNNTGAYDAGAIENNGGTLTVNNCNFNNNKVPAGNGGAIYNSGTLTVTNSTFTNNTATSTDNGGNGGVIYNNQGTATINSSTFTNNTAAGNGGAIYNNYGTLTLNNSTFINNIVNASSQKLGGAIDSYYGILSVTNSTFTNNTAFYGGAIFIDGGSLIVDNSTFNKNSANNYGEGGAIFNSYNDGGTVTVTNSNFNENTGATGGAISNEYQNGNGALTVVNSTFTNNSAMNYGGAIYNNANDVVSTVTNCTFINNTSNYAGGAISNVGALIISNSTFMNNNATQYGGAIDTEGGTNTNLTITGSTLTGNSAGYEGGAINNWVTLTAHYNRIANNTARYGKELSSSGSADITLNWWGTNNPTSSWVNGTDIYGLDLSSWLILNMTSNLNNTNIGGNVTATAILEQENPDGSYSSVGDNMPAGIPVTFSGSKGTVNTTSTILVNGEAKTVFTATHAGAGVINVTVDNQTVTLQITVNPSQSKITAGNVTGVNGNSVNLTATLTDTNGNPISGQSVSFSVNGTAVGSATTNNSGLASLAYTPTSRGNYTVTASYNGSTDYLSSEGNGTLTVNPSAYLYLNVTTSTTTSSVGKTLIVTYKLGNSGLDTADNVTVTFKIPDGLDFVTATVDSGNWTYNSTTRMLTWTLDNVPVGDPYLNITVTPLSTGSYTIVPTVTSLTANQNTNVLTSITLLAQAQNNNNTNVNNVSNRNNTTNTVNAATQTIAMQHTGAPLAGLALAILAIFSGMLPRRKQ